MNENNLLSHLYTFEDAVKKTQSVWEDELSYKFFNHYKLEDTNTTILDFINQTKVLISEVNTLKNKLSSL